MMTRKLVDSKKIIIILKHRDQQSRPVFISFSLFSKKQGVGRMRRTKKQRPTKISVPKLAALKKRKKIF